MNHVATILIALCLSSCACAADVPMAGTSRCQGEPASDKTIQALHKDVERGDLFKFASAQFGAPVSCQVKFEASRDGGYFSRLTYRFEKGSASFESFPPESAVITLEAGEGFAQEAAVRAAFQGLNSVKQFRIDWQRKPDVSTDKGERMERYSTSAQGTNAMADFISKGGKLVRISLHYAL